jgi:hypothetical protein
VTLAAGQTVPVQAQLWEQNLWANAIVYVQSTEATPVPAPIMPGSMVSPERPSPVPVG